VRDLIPARGKASVFRVLSGSTTEIYTRFGVFVLGDDSVRFDLERRLEAYFATLRPSSLRDVLKRTANWGLYAAAGGSVVAMMTGASASAIRNTGRVQPGAGEPARRVRLAKSILAVSSHTPSIQAIRNEGFTRPNVEAAAQAHAPVISNGGVVPLDSRVGTIQAGEIASIWGTNLATTTATWNGDFPTSLGGTSVTINGKPAYLLYVSPADQPASAGRYGGRLGIRGGDYGEWQRHRIGQPGSGRPSA
jgi:hypothetical protein